MRSVGGRSVAEVHKLDAGAVARLPDGSAFTADMHGRKRIAMREFYCGGFP